jgi:hypothetical protein
MLPVTVDMDLGQRLFPRDLVEVQVEVESATFAFVVRSAGEVAARGTFVTAFVQPGVGATPWPDDIRRAFAETGPVRGERYAMIDAT